MFRRLLTVACLASFAFSTLWAQDDPIRSMTTQKYDFPWLICSSGSEALAFHSRDVMLLIEYTVYPGSWDESMHDMAVPASSDKGSMRIAGPSQIVVRQTKDVHAAITNLLKTLRQVADDRKKTISKVPPGASQLKRGGRPVANERPLNRTLYKVPGDSQKVGPDLALFEGESESEYVVKIHRLSDLVRFGDLDHINKSVELLETQVAPETWNIVGGPASLMWISHLEVFVVRQTPTNHAAIEEILEKIRSRKEEEP